MHKLAIILPCYNEQEVLPITIKILTDYLKTLINRDIISNDSFICFVDDGSKDDTWNIIEKYREQSGGGWLKGIKLSSNCGHQNALLAGLFSNINKADIYISMDADLQDDMSAIERMIYSYSNGSEIVYGVRKSREVDTLFKRKTAELFYDIQLKLGINIVKNHADFRLISNNVLKHLREFSEVNLYLRAMFPIIGFKSDIVYYSRKERLAGISKYPLKKMISFAWDGITSFSVFPLKLITIIGGFIFCISIAMVLYILYLKLFTVQTIPGWASITMPIYFIGGIQLLSIGIIGEYLGKVYKETKKRPRFIIEKEI
ncbi:glycosyltransferase family 2 protein [Campylobacter hyointestinalis]|uniref:glycosyltransferase family 2 protein n=1 Tax=Campylobacter hyointestinalis TaxID=198 RepID=UPI002552BC78|nr:glycosyltransferase family 2 protein [Campylobacter hyointestinalis]MDL2346074.1 glycosyltransferase family 2 protein [Campylobacter hyointestinalis]MDL2347814.1 glycosyltransferase family 2 protein [Campylobacter hyointestinalis]MDL2349556.1 glycosyltransferase family 2 protein [Campylobacter hyointestinalis]MDM1025769.1 glycosyltransferase family 2 protein [Campylobacter hyointestinalis]MDM1028426.1 glycosyltransferase family 2 protein [Campylobacter hyointestinalis]